MKSGTLRIGVSMPAWLALLLTLGACSPRAEVAKPEKPITINLNVKIDHEVRLKVDKDLEQALPNDHALLNDAKTNGLVGERSNGYLGMVDPSNAEAQALIVGVNQKRRQVYEDIATRNLTSVQVVETLAGDKFIQNTKPGNFIERSGEWIKK